MRRILNKFCYISLFGLALGCGVEKKKETTVCMALSVGPSLEIQTDFDLPSSMKLTITDHVVFSDRTETPGCEVEGFDDGSTYKRDRVHVIREARKIEILDWGIFRAKELERLTIEAIDCDSGSVSISNTFGAPELVMRTGRCGSYDVPVLHITEQNRIRSP